MSRLDNDATSFAWGGRTTVAKRRREKILKIWLATKIFQCRQAQAAAGQDRLARKN